MRCHTTVVADSRPDPADETVETKPSSNSVSEPAEEMRRPLPHRLMPQGGGSTLKRAAASALSGERARYHARLYHGAR
jgi:hypothetical protein